MADYIRQLSRAPEHIRQDLRMNDIRETEADAYLFNELYDIEHLSWITEAISLLPESLHRDIKTNQAAHDILARIRKSCQATGSMKDYTSLQLHNCAETAGSVDNADGDTHRRAIETAAQKWRHWKPRFLAAASPLTQRQIELILADKWSNRLIKLFVPQAKNIPAMSSARIPAASGAGGRKTTERMEGPVWHSKIYQPPEPLPGPGEGSCTCPKLHTME